MLLIKISDHCLFFFVDYFTTLSAVQTTRLYDAGVLCDKAALLGTTIKRTICICKRVTYSMTLSVTKIKEQ
jgi:hypothetical protein